MNPALSAERTPRPVPFVVPIGALFLLALPACLGDGDGGNGSSNPPDCTGHSIPMVSSGHMRPTFTRGPTLAEAGVTEPLAMVTLFPASSMLAFEVQDVCGLEGMLRIAAAIQPDGNFAVRAPVGESVITLAGRIGEDFVPAAELRITTRASTRSFLFVPGTDREGSRR